ncbi:MAG: LLM class flavin-dependent oxidoreductase [Luteolibacter sp.]
MSQSKRQIKLGAFFLGAGHHLAAWRHPESQPDAGFNIGYYQKVARTAERGKFHALFLSDYLGAPPAPKNHLSSVANTLFDPITLLAALAGVTENIGLIATVSTSYLHPFHLARRFSTLDHISGGRAGWNIVTSTTDFEAANFGLEKQPAHHQRYRIADEYIAAVKNLWDAFEDDAYIFDRESATAFDPDKFHPHPHRGEHYSIQGSLLFPRPIQGYPLLVQAGSSEDGQNFAATHGELIFTAQHDLKAAQNFYRSIREKVAVHGRNQDEILILPGISPIIGESEAHARELHEELQSLIPENVGLGLLSIILGHDISGYPIDGPLPEIPNTEGWKSRQQLIVDLARTENLTIRQTYQRFAGARGHRIIFGNASGIADQLEDWFHHEAADGFNIMPPVFPKDLDLFVDKVIPELQRRGLFRTEYEGRTLRENLGLRRPQNQYTLPR